MYLMTKTSVKKGWKVVVESGRRSALMSEARGGRIYHKNIWVNPEDGCGPLCVFSTKKTANLFLDDWATPRIAVKCEYIPSSREHVWNGVNQWPLYDLPHGTKLADAVKCLL